MPRYIDITGNRYGKLIVLEPTERRDINGRMIWKCLCDCGNISYHCGTMLRTGRIKSCGCGQNLTVNIGYKCGELTVIKNTGKKTNTKHPNMIWLCQCSCGNQIECSGQSLLQRHIFSCGCLSSSIGEKRIGDILQENNIIFEKQKMFSDCKDKAKLRFDFYLPDYNCCIEYNGKQHYEAIDYFGGEESFLAQQNRDKIKEKYCQDNNIKLIVIPYKDFSKLDINYLLNKIEN